MSRCFPYPPPGYVKQFNAASMIESLKTLQKVEKAKKERKEKKRDKKDKEKTRGCVEIDEKKHKDKIRHKHKRRQDVEKGQEHQKRRENEMEQVEKSNLTEEHGHRIRVSSQNSFDSSDSTPNHNTKRHRSSSSNDGTKKSGSTISFPLPCQSYKDDQTEQLGSDAGNCVQEGNVVACKPLGEVPAKASQHPARTSSGREASCYTSGASGVVPQKLKRNPQPSYCSDSPYELKVRSLFENWLPPQSCEEVPFDDQEWLFSPKKNHSRETKRMRTITGGSGYKGSAPCSRGCYLPEADLYALPFTVPF